jgi:hypothetical protein
MQSGRSQVGANFRRRRSPNATVTKMTIGIRRAGRATPPLGGRHKRRHLGLYRAGAGLPTSKVPLVRTR